MVNSSKVDIFALLRDLVENNNFKSLFKRSF